jgi:hypothetical protein
MTLYIGVGLYSTTTYSNFQAIIEIILLIFLIWTEDVDVDEVLNLIQALLYSAKIMENMARPWVDDLRSVE